MGAMRAFAIVLVALLAGGGVQAQGTGDTQRKLEKLKRELKDVAAQRRRTEGQRGDASRALRDADEQVGRSIRATRRVVRDHEHAAARDARIAQRSLERAQLNVRNAPARAP